MTFKGISLSNDNYIFLNCIEGKEEIIKMHNEIYSKILNNHSKKVISYVPHITLGQSNKINNLKKFNYSFRTLINEISIELIGENEESIVIHNISL